MDATFVGIKQAIPEKHVKSLTLNLLSKVSLILGWVGLPVVRRQSVVQRIRLVRCVPLIWLDRLLKLKRVQFLVLEHAKLTCET
jgi:hypothetical protein